jgi:P27 family predicted phage terminase small subunit
MKTGRPRTPTSLKLIKGSYRKDRALKGEPKPAPALPEPPEFLSPGAKQEWNRVAPELHKLGLLSQIDVAALSCYCEAWSDFIDSSKRCIGADGKDLKVLRAKNSADDPSSIYINPYYAIKRRSAETVLKFASEFAMTPQARTRISATPPGDNTPNRNRWDDFAG